MNEDRGQIERVVLDQLLQRERLRRLEDGTIAHDVVANALIGEMAGHLLELRGREEQQRTRQDDVDEVERIGQTIADVGDTILVVAISGCDRLDERVVFVSVAAGRDVENDDVIVDRAEVFEDLAKFIDLAILLRDEVEKIGIERQAERRGDRSEGEDQRGDGDLFAMTEAESGERV